MTSKSRPARAAPEAHRHTVLIVGAFPPPDRVIFGGTVSSCLMLVESTLKDRFHLVLVDSTQISQPPPGFAKRLQLAARRLFQYSRELRRTSPAAVILFSTLGASHWEKGLLGWIARLRGIPVLTFPRAAALIDTAHSGLPGRWFVRVGFSSATHFLCQGAAWQRFAVQELRFSRSRAPIVPNWTAAPRLLDIGRERRQRTDGAPLQILFLGWIEKEKGVFELLQACSRLAATHRFRLVLAGGGHAEAEARRRVTEASLDDLVSFAGWVKGEALEDLFRSSDILALPSWGEGLPNAMIEAMAAGLAVVVSAVGNVPDVVTDGKTALLVPPKDPEALARVLQKVLEDAALRDVLAANGHALVRGQFGLDAAVDRLSEVLDAAIREWRSGRQPLVATGSK